MSDIVERLAGWENKGHEGDPMVDMLLDDVSAALAEIKQLRFANTYLRDVNVCLKADLYAEREAPRALAERRLQAKERRRAVQWLHERAASMKDPKARAILHSAATNLGWHNSREKGPAAASPGQTEEAKER